MLPDYINYHQGLHSVIRGQRLIGVLTNLFGDEAVLFKDKVRPSSHSSGPEEELTGW
jgi:hypothetical protein